MHNMRFITGVMVAAGLAASNIVLGAGAASAYSGYITEPTCSSITVGWSADPTDPTGYFTLTAVATSGESTQIQRTPVAAGDSMTDQPITLPQLSGTGPWEIRLTWDSGDRNMTLIDSVAVSACVAVKPTLTPLTGTCQVRVTPAGAVVNFALASGKPVTRTVNSTLLSTTSTTATYNLDVVGAPSKTELRSGFSLKGLVNGVSFAFKAPGNC